MSPWSLWGKAAAVFIALDERALRARDGRAVRSDEVGINSMMGHIELKDAKFNVADRVIDLGQVQLRPPRPLGSFRINGSPPADLSLGIVLFRGLGHPSTGGIDIIRKFRPEDRAPELVGATGPFGGTDIALRSCEGHIAFKSYGEAQAWQVSLVSEFLRDLRVGRRLSKRGEAPADWG